MENTMNGNESKSPISSVKSSSPDGDEKQILLSNKTAPVIVKVIRSSSSRSRSRFRAGPTRKLRRRAVLKNGDCNVLQSRISKRSWRFIKDIFTTLVDAQWRWTLLCFSLSFMLSWLGFAVIWWLIAFTHGDFEEAHLPPFQTENNWTPCVYNIFSFTSCFLFSIETQHTIGYGSRSTTEECPEAIFVMCVQSIAGVMIQAFMVGIVFAKMSRPKKRTQTLLFSTNAVICQRDGELCLMFRVGDMRKSHIIGAAVRAQLIRSRTTKEGEVLSQNQLELSVGTDGQNGNLFFIWPTTIVHKINAESPFYNMSAEDMLTQRFEVVAILEGTIESTGQTTQARSSYLPQEILWGHRFEPMVMYSKERQGYEVDYSLFNSTTQVDTPLCSGRELAEFYKVQEELRHGNGVIVDEDFLSESCQDTHYHYGHRPLIVTNHQPGHHPLINYTDSGRSETSADEASPCRNACRDSSCHGPPIPNRDHDRGQYKIFDLDPDGIQVMGETELQHLPEAVNKEILRNSREIIFEEPEASREGSPLLLKSNSKRNILRHPLLDEERKSLNSSKRNLYHKNILRSFEEDKRSLDGSRRNLNGSRRYLLIPLDDKKAEIGNRESFRRHTGSRERLNAIRRNISAKGSREIEHDARGRVNSTDDRLMIEMEKSVKSPRQQEIIAESNRTSISDPNLSPNAYIPPLKNHESPLIALPISPMSDASPESGFYEGTQWSSSPEYIRKDLQLPHESTITRNRRSYENAQLQDVNEVLSRPNSDNSSLDSEGSTKNMANDGGPRTYEKKQAISYTSV
ncbi:uncharacterized protein LOC108629754 isoform X2 [Ceratina calcarata]|uniref:Uncharacterized protein LOC108629754 isoform X2 n=1 Tax=Ceratina calcarata TaxID=156304 RepID=A0AAJ7NC83_9HYME|nr:uncharacterized protein LOC108629754 isoform X2 [Ceratina calcarata]XP_026673366.1 uncharacterized protein LOC108629754 isoform X2 [Ceratina calcarata]